MIQFKVGHRLVEDCQSDLLVTFAYEGKFAANPHLKNLDGWLDGYIANMFAIEEFTGKANQLARIFPSDRIPAPKVLLVGLGRKSEIGRNTIREYGGTIGKTLPELKSETCCVMMPSLKACPATGAEVGQMIVEGIALGSYEMEAYKTISEARKLPSEIFISTDSKAEVRAVTSGAETGRVTAWAQNTARDLVSHPPIYLTPTRLSGYAQEFADDYKFKCTVMSKSEIKKEGLNCLLAVNAGSDQPPKFIILEYKGPKARKKKLCLVGKGITFDSGGYSLKEPDKMVEMKGDMAGAACVMTAIAAAAQLRLPVHVVGLIPSTENLVSGSGYKPGDVLKSHNGKTIEITNTDAEGRLILADALSFARKYDPDLVVDIATLTSAAQIALGFTGAAFFADDDAVAAKIDKASVAASEPVWRMPLWPGYLEYIKSRIADIKNSAGRIGSLCTSAAFLSHFKGDYAWAHIDIAGMDVDVKEGSYSVKGSSGFGARLLIELMRIW